MRVWNFAALGCVVSVLAATVAGCGSGSSTTTKSTPTTTAPANQSSAFGEILLRSSAFKNGKPIPVAYTCSGSGGPPPLQWSKVPGDAVELFIITLDLGKDGRNKILWAAGGIQPGDGQISAGATPAGAVLGKNDFGKLGWSGVCGARGERHRVAFLLYALRQKLHLKAGFNPIAIRPQLKAATVSTGLTIASYKHA